MPIPIPSLDDRDFDDLVEELLERVSAHTPEWNPRLGDPGRTIVELFAWLTDTLLYRANLIPERQRLAFLRLLGMPLRAAVPARGIVTVAIDDPETTEAIALRPLAKVEGPVNFETRGELTVLPVTAAVFYKRKLTVEENTQFAEVLPQLQQIYQLDEIATPYITTPIFVGGVPEKGGLNLSEQSVDRCLWLALLASKPELVEAVKQSWGRNRSGGQLLLNLGIVPTLEIPNQFEDPNLFAEIGSRAKIPHVWEITTDREPEYLPLEELENEDSTVGLTRRGVLRLKLPASEWIGAPSNDIRTPSGLSAGVGDRPPRIEVPEMAERLITWLRLRPTADLSSLSLSWVGINAVEIDQRQTIIGRIVGQSNGTANQEIPLPGQSIEPESLQIQVEEPGRGYQLWQQVEDLALIGRDTAAYSLDNEAGTIRFGDGVRGRIPEVGMRIRVAQMRAGGGRSGNLSPGSLTEISALGLERQAIAQKLQLLQSLPTEGGEEAETLEAAEQRIPALLRHRDRAVTAADYRQIAAETPGIDLGRVEVLPRFKPHQRRDGVPGVISVMILPQKTAVQPRNPRPDRSMLEAAYAHLDTRRPLGTELYVIGCEYCPVGITVAVEIQAGFGRDSVLMAVREGLYRFVWPLPLDGVSSRGWSLGRAVRERELEVAVARVPGVSSVIGLNLFSQQKGETAAAHKSQEKWHLLGSPAEVKAALIQSQSPELQAIGSATTQQEEKQPTSEWRIVRPLGSTKGAEIQLQGWQLPELLEVIVVADTQPPEDLTAIFPPSSVTGELGVAVPVVPEVC